MRDKESIGAVNEGTLQCESIQRLKQGRGRLCARERNDKVLLGLANGREGWPTLGLLLYFIFFIFKPNRFGSVWVGWFRHIKTGNRTGPDIFLNILTGSISFLYRFGFFG
jgi:hypothetical protein